MVYLSAASLFTTVYHIFAIVVYCCIAAIVVLMLIFGLRARRNVKKERVTRMPDGFSPLDVKRIFIGKTYPRRLTRALIAHWAQRGFINVKYVSKYRVKIHKLKDMPKHDDETAFFFDRGTYVRERDMFYHVIGNYKNGKTINLLRPLFTKDEAKAICNGYAVKEYEGVYTALHFRLKITALVLSVLPLISAVIWSGYESGNYMGLLMIGTGVIGMFVLMFAHGMPIIFKFLWCGLWLGASIGSLVAMFMSLEYDPLLIGYISVGIFFLGPLFFIRFIDYRAKNNLADYSDLVNFRKFLLFAPRSEVDKLDYYETLPLLYALNIKTLVRGKFSRKDELPQWYKSDGKRSALL